MATFKVKARLIDGATVDLLHQGDASYNVCNDLLANGRVDPDIGITVRYSEVISCELYDPAKSDENSRLSFIEKIEQAKISGDFSLFTSDEVERATKQITATTTDAIPSLGNYETIDIVGAECALGLNFIRDILVEARDIFGGRSATLQNALRTARQTCMNELRLRALIQGADAILAVRFNFSEVSGGGKNSMVLMIATGTAIKRQAQ